MIVSTDRSISLRDLLRRARTPGLLHAPEADPEVRAITVDSRNVRPGTLFVALRGHVEDGHTYLSAARDAGAVAAVVEERDESLGRWPQVEVADTRRILGALAHEVYRHPTDRVPFLGVTGTNGKTSVVHYCDAIAQAAGREAGLIGTIETRWRGKRFSTNNTTPGADELHRLVREMVDDGVEVIASEISSHAIEMHRVSSVHFAAIALTNVKSDHLDYHKTNAAYRETKMRLFYKKGADSESVTVDHVVLNIDDETGRHVASTTDLPVLSFGFHDEADLQGTILRSDRAGIHMHISWEGEDQMLSLPAIGAFNASNALGAIGLGLTQEITLQEAVTGLAEVPPVPGRLQRVEAGQPFLVLLDYAHSANAISTVLAAAREITEGDVIFVFGCGGDRDQGKRMDMGCAAGRGADFCVVTDDNPRHEDPAVIRAEAEKGLIQTNVRYENIGDRRKAIRVGLGRATPGDVVIIAGKGHEEVQIVGDVHLPFSDDAVVREILEDE